MANAATVRVSVPAEALEAYNSFIRSIKSKPGDISNFNSPFSTRAVVTLVLLRKALKLGGFPHDIEFTSSPNAQRAQLQVRSGRSIAVGTDLWSEKFDDQVFKSTAIIKEGQFVKGIYGLLENKKLFAVKSLKDLKECCSIVSSSMWAVDKITIDKMKLNSVFDTATARSMVKMVSKKRADFTIWEFQGTDDLSLRSFGETLFPVPNIKIALRSTRHYMVSKKHPLGIIYFKALRKGVAILLKQKAYEKGYAESGFFNSKTQNWNAINIEN